MTIPSTSTNAPEANAKRIAQERDLFASLLELTRERNVAAVLDEALSLVVKATSSTLGHLEVTSAGDGSTWSCDLGATDADRSLIRARISRGIVTEAMATGNLVNTPSAILDDRFSDRKSVQAGQLEAVLCAPIGEPPPIGVLYLQGGKGRGAFGVDDLALVKAFTTHVAPILERVIAFDQSYKDADATRQWREKLAAESIVGRSAALAKVLEQVSLVASHTVTVLLQGPSGVGKTAIAKVVHDSGPRKAHPFVELNCAALPDDLAEAELFGAVAGSHSTATEDRVGKIAAADGGTLFLDEVAELSLRLQAKLLQVLQSGVYYPLGESEPRTVDVRIITATNADLEQRAKDKTFREDLFYRLNVLPIHVPPLSDRGDDVILLAEHIAEVFALKSNAEAPKLTPAAKAALRGAEWPGNVRQLANVVQAGVLRSMGRNTGSVDVGDLFPNAEAAATESEAGLQTWQDATRAFQRTYLAEVLDALDWNVSEAARKLELARSTLYELIRVHELKRQ